MICAKIISLVQTCQVEGSMCGGLLELSSYVRRVGSTSLLASTSTRRLGSRDAAPPRAPRGGVLTISSGCSPGTPSVRLDLGKERPQERVERAPIGRVQRLHPARFVRDVRFERLVDRRLAVAGQPNERAAPVVRIWPALD
jgi:hypothetical protein